MLNGFLLFRINIRIEHVNHSKCREDFMRRVKENERKRKEAKDNKVEVLLNRQVSFYFVAFKNCVH